MKKIKFTGKLSLNKETVSKLNDEQMNQVYGGTRGSGCTGTRYCEPTTATCPPQSDTCPTVTLNTIFEATCVSC